MKKETIILGKIKQTQPRTGLVHNPMLDMAFVTGVDKRYYRMPQAA